MKLFRKNGTTGVIVRVFIQDTSSSTGGGKTGLTNESSGLNISVIADIESSATSYTSAGSDIDTINTIGTYESPDPGQCRFKEVDSTNLPGIYEIQLLDTIWAVSDAKSLVVGVTGVSGAAPVFAEFDLGVDELVNNIINNQASVAFCVENGAKITEYSRLFFVNYVNGTTPVKATATVTITTNLVGAETITLYPNDGSAIVYTFEGEPSATQVQIGGDENETASNLNTFINAQGVFSSTVLNNVVTVSQRYAGSTGASSVIGYSNESSTGDISVTDFTGGSGGTGSLSNPVRTIGEAYMLASSGRNDVIFVASDGTTGSIDERIEILKSNISIIGASHGVSWTKSNQPADSSVITIAASNVTISNFKIYSGTSSTADAIRIKGSNNKIKNMLFTGAKEACVHLDASSTTVSNNIVECCLFNASNTSYGSGGAGVLLSGANCFSNQVVHNNMCGLETANNNVRGIYLTTSAHDNVIKDNVVHNCDYGIEDGGVDNVVAQNTIGGNEVTDLTTVGTTVSMNNQAYATATTAATIQAKTDLIPSSPASTTNITAGTITTVSGNVNGSVGSVVGLTASNLDATISSRLASSSYTTPPTVTEIRTEVDSNSTQLAAIKTKTDLIPANPASTTNITAGTITTVSGNVNGSVASVTNKVTPIDADGTTYAVIMEYLLAFMTGKAAITDNGSSINTITFKKVDGTTTSFSRSFNTSTGARP